MAKYPVRLATMQKVRDHYDNVKPIRGTNTRPIGCRGRKHEEIRKVDDNTFHLGIGWCSYLDNGAVREGAFIPYIEWHEDAKGVVTVTIMNGIGDFAHCSIYTFHDYFMPEGMWHSVSNGKQFVQTGGATKRDYLPKGGGSDNRKPLVYSRPDPHKSWVLASKPYPLPRKVVDKERKAKYKEGIHNFVEWAWTMIPIIGEECRKSWYESQQRRLTVGMRSDPTKTAREAEDRFMAILIDATKEGRVDILCEFMTEGYDNAHTYWDYANAEHVKPDPFSDPKKFRSKLNAFVNKYGGFTSTKG